MNVSGVATPFTLLSLHSTSLIDHRWVVHEPEKLAATVELRIREHNQTHRIGI
jgi:hypothetical protein